MAHMASQGCSKAGPVGSPRPCTAIRRTFIVRTGGVRTSSASCLNETTRQPFNPPDRITSGGWEFVGVCKEVAGRPCLAGVFRGCPDARTEYAVKAEMTHRPATPLDPPAREK